MNSGATRIYFLVGLQESRQGRAQFGADARYCTITIKNKEFVSHLGGGLKPPNPPWLCRL